MIGLAAIAAALLLVLALLALLAFGGGDPAQTAVTLRQPPNVLLLYLRAVRSRLTKPAWIEGATKLPRVQVRAPQRASVHTRGGLTHDLPPLAPPRPRPPQVSLSRPTTLHPPMMNRFKELVGGLAELLSPPPRPAPPKKPCRTQVAATARGRRRRRCCRWAGSGSAPTTCRSCTSSQRRSGWRWP
jgi:hypothetical protein